jgi:HD-GYP domain-containing protein (c-di-GMP phosphodiesterase class II)
MVGYSPVFLPQLETAALLHDIGKIAVPDRILLKPDRLTVDEFNQMKRHADAGADILQRVRHLRPATDIVRHHHERYDGSGYPSGLAGEDIPFGARIFTVADTLDAMTSDRCYRRALPYSAAVQEIVRCSGTQFDPKIVEAFCRVPEGVWTSIRAETETRYETNWFQ